MVCPKLFLAGFLVLIGTVFGAPYHDPHCGGRQVIVHLFEWKWTSISRECLEYLGPKGFCGVQVSPPNEHYLKTLNNMRPWWERYQPVSYNLTSSSGDENEFKVMVETCNSVGVRVYVDAVINHMAAAAGNGRGSAGNSFDSSSRDYPGVPYTEVNFNNDSHCPVQDGSIRKDPAQVRNCPSRIQADLDLSQTFVQDKISGYFNHLIDLGVAGFSIDSAEYMWPEHLKAVQAKTKDLPEGGRPFFYLEVTNYLKTFNVTEYFPLGRVTEFQYSERIIGRVRNLESLKEIYDPTSDMVESAEALVFVDNHENQRAQQHGALHFMQPEFYKRAVAFTLAFDYGFTKIMSSFYYDSPEQGPPHNPDFSVKDVTMSSSGKCENGWVCEHRWNPIGNMAAFRNAVVGENVENWHYDDGVLSFNRGAKGFFAMATRSFSAKIYTGLPQGRYCDLISACAMIIEVDKNGDAVVQPAYDSDPFVAIITDSGKPVDKFPLGKGTAPPTPSPLPPRTTDYRKTVILIEKRTTNGQDLFIDGGIDHDHRQGCEHGKLNSPCSIPIRHINPGSDPHFNKVKAWSSGDNYLDWYGAEPKQGTYNRKKASGTPAYWSTNDRTHPGHNPYNKYGPHYWVVEVEMDCSKTVNSFFEFKARVNGQWEQNISKTGACTGESAGTPPFRSQNHFARCGYLNVFHYNQKGCEIYALR